MDEWLDEANAIRAAVPAARFGLPDTAGNPDWYAAVVNRLLTLQTPPDVAALSHHYYIGGPPSNPRHDHRLHPLPQPQGPAARSRHPRSRRASLRRRAQNRPLPHDRRQHLLPRRQARRLRRLRRQPLGRRLPPRPRHQRLRRRQPPRRHRQIRRQLPRRPSPRRRHRPRRTRRPHPNTPTPTTPPSPT